MKVKKLIEHLQKLDENLDLYSSIDDEGNGYNEICAPSIGFIRKDDMYRPESVYTEKELKEMAKEDGVPFKKFVNDYKKIVILK